jgi:hypothetical protein
VYREIKSPFDRSTSCSHSVVINKIEETKTPLDNVSIRDGSLFLGSYLGFSKLDDAQLFPPPARYRC